MTTPDPTHKNTIAERVLERIDTEHMRPRPRWAFVFENYFFWGLGVVAVILGALAFSAIIFEVQNADWQYAFITHNDIFSFALDVVPLVWIGVLALFIGIGYVNVKRTQHGYRYPLLVIAIAAVLASLALGSALYVRGFGASIESATGNTPLFNSIVEKQQRWWLAPARGLLGGTVIESTPDVSSFTLRDSSGAVWSIDASDLNPHDLAAVAHGGMVHVVGVPTVATSSQFHACFVFPWEIAGEMRLGPRPFPVAFVASSTGRRPAVSDACAHTSPYAKLRELDDRDDL